MNSQMNLMRAQLHREGLRAEAMQRRGAAARRGRPAILTSEESRRSVVFGRVLRSGWNF